jgi:hypothetical protein
LLLLRLNLTVDYGMCAFRFKKCAEQGMQWWRHLKYDPGGGWMWESTG